MTRSLLRVEPAGPLPSVTDVLAGAVPTLVVHRSYHNSAMLPDLVQRAQAVCTRDAAVAVATRLPVQAPPAAQSFLGSVPTAALRIADPEIHTLPGPTHAPHLRQLKQAAKYRYGGVQVPATPDPGWIRDVLDAQYAAGANVMLSASGWVGATQGAQQLTTAMSFVHASRAQLGADDPMFVNLTLDTGWLRNQTLLGILLQEIVESPEALWWVRVIWEPLRPNGYSQLVDRALLEGYRELAEVVRNERKTLFLPNSGLTGWFATGLGASGFSTGMSSPERAYLNQGPQGGGGAGVPRERFFERTLLHTILRADQGPLVRRAGYQRCGCAYCRQLASGPWQKPLEQLHYLHNVAELVAALGRTGRRAAARNTVRQAQAFKTQLTGAARLAGESDPKHLDEWANLL